MKKKASLILILLVIGLVVPLAPMSASASPSPSTVASTTTYGDSTGYAYQKHTFQAQGLYWVLYSDGVNLVFKTSSDAITWSGPTTIAPSTRGFRSSIYYDNINNKLHIVYCETNTGPIYYRRGTPQSSGTITWDAAAQTVVGSNANIRPTITVDSGGYPWIGYYTSTYPYVTKSSTNDGTWTTASGFPYQLSTTSGSWRVLVNRLTNSKVYVIYSLTTNTYGKLYDGGFGLQETVTTLDTISEGASAISVGDDVCFAFNEATSYDIHGLKRSWGVGWGSVEDIDLAEASDSVPALSFSGSTILAFWEKADTIYYNERDGNWGSATTFVSGETGTSGYAITTCLEDLGSKIGVAWTGGSPYPVRFDYLPDPLPPLSSNSDSATCDPFQRKTFQDLGLYWLWYSNGTNMGFSTSADGSPGSWSSFHSVRPATYGFTFSVVHDENNHKVHYVAYPSGDSGQALYYRMGTLNSDGTITWDAEEQIAVPATNNILLYYPTIALDYYGYPWIGYYWGNLTSPYNRRAYVTRSSTNNGIWTTSDGFPYLLHQDSGGDDSFKVIVLSLSSQKMYILYPSLIGLSPRIYGRLYDSGFGSEENITQSFYDSSAISAISIEDDVYFSYLEDVSYDIHTLKRSYDTGWGAPETVATSQTDTSYPVMSYDSPNKAECVLWSNNGSILRSYRVNGVWGSPITLVSGKTDLLGYTLTAFSKSSYNNEIGIAWTQGSSAPYNVRFDHFSEQAPFIAGIGDLPGLSGLVYAYQTVNLNISVYDGNGRSDLKNATLSLSVGDIDLTWIESSNTTSIIDPHNYAELVSSVITAKSDQEYEIAWYVRFYWNYTENYVGVDSGTSVFDDDNLSGTFEQQNWFYFEHDLKVCNGQGVKYNVEWQGEYEDFGYDLYVDSTGIYAAGTSYYANRVLLVKYSLDRIQQWNKTFGVDGQNWQCYAITKNNGMLYLAGYVYDSNEGKTHAFLMKCDENGNQLWNITWAASDQDIFFDLVSNGDYIYAAGQTGFPAPQYALLVKYDQSGNQQWNVTWADGFDDTLYASYWGITTDGSYIYSAGYYMKDIGDADWVLSKYDLSGNRQWNVSWGTVGQNDIAEGVTVGGGYIYACGNAFTGPKIYATLVKFDTSGNKIWNVSHTVLSDFRDVKFDNNLVCCSGPCFEGTSFGTITVCYSSEGACRWEEVDYLSSASADTDAPSIFIYNGNAYVIGYYAISTHDLLILEYDDITTRNTIALTISPSQSISLSGHIYYEGTTIAPYSSTGITVSVELSGVVKSSTTTIGSDGSFTLPAFNGPSTPGLYEYTIFSTDANSVQNVTVMVTVTGGGLTTIYLRAIPTSITINQNELFYLNGYLTLTLGGSDGVSGKTIYLQRLNGDWANVTSAVTDSYGHAVFQITEGAWGTYQYRLKFFGDETYNAATSDLVTVTVKVGGGNPPPQPPTQPPPPDTDTGVTGETPGQGHVINPGRTDTLTIRINSTRGFTLVGIDFYGDYASWVTLVTEIPIHSVYSEENGYHYVDVVIKVRVPSSTPEGSYEIQYNAHLIYDETGQEAVIVGVVEILVKALPEITFQALGLAALLSVFIIPLLWRRKKEEEKRPLGSGPLRYRRY